MKFGLHLFILAALAAGCSPEEKPEPTNDKLQKRIDILDAEINHYEKKAMEDEVQSMGAFRDNYSKFADEMEESEKNEERVRELEKEKEALLHPSHS